jgi:hypothetical protein
LQQLDSLALLPRPAPEAAQSPRSVELGRSKSESSGRDQSTCERTLGRVCLLQRNEQVALSTANSGYRMFFPSCRSSQKTGGVSSSWYRAMLELETRAELVMFALANGVIGPNAG